MREEVEVDKGRVPASSFVPGVTHARHGNNLVLGVPSRPAG